MNSFEGQNPGNVRKVDANDYNLQGLRSLHDHELAEGVPDVRGWRVVDRNGDRIGKVDDLIVDPVAQAVRYIDVDLRDVDTPDDKDYHLLIPVGTARLDDNDDCVHADNLVKDQLIQYPRAARGGINRTYENDVRTFYDNGTRSAGQYFGNSRTDEVIGGRQLDKMGGTMGTDLSASRSASPDDATFHGSRDLNAGDTSLDEFRSADTYSNVSNLDVPVTGSTTATDSYTISGSELRDQSNLDRNNDLDRSGLNTPAFTSSTGFENSTSLDDSTGLDSSTALRDSDILDSPTPLENRGIIDGGNNLASGAYANNFMDEDRNDLNSRNTLDADRADLGSSDSADLNRTDLGSTGTTHSHVVFNDRTGMQTGQTGSINAGQGDADYKQVRDVNDERTNSFTDRNNELSNFAENHLRQPGSTRSDQTEPGTFGGTDFYTDSHFDETRFFGNRFSGQRRGGISTFPEGEGRFTLRRRNI
jgi:hypothetical protein